MKLEQFYRFHTYEKEEHGAWGTVSTIYIITSSHNG